MTNMPAELFAKPAIEQGRVFPIKIKEQAKERYISLISNNQLNRLAVSMLEETILSNVRKSH